MQVSFKTTFRYIVVLSNLQLNFKTPSIQFPVSGTFSLTVYLSLSCCHFIVISAFILGGILKGGEAWGGGISCVHCSSSPIMSLCKDIINRKIFVKYSNFCKGKFDFNDFLMINTYFSSINIINFNCGRKSAKV